MMRKEKIALDPENHFFIDVCPDCEVVWFDGGELARLQLDYERSAQAVEAYAMKQQAESRSPEDAAEFRSRLEALPKPATFLTLVTSGTSQAIVIAVLISAALAFVLWFILWG